MFRRITALLAFASLPLAAGGAAAAHDLAPVAGPQGDCGWFDPAAVADLPVDEAAEELSELSSFTAAVAITDLDEQLADDGPFTVFAPSNAAIEAIPANVFDAMAADTDLLSTVLGYHVVVGEMLSPDQLAAQGTVATLTGELTISAEADALMVNGGEATVTCGGIQTANATIYVIDRVLQPATDALCPGDSTVPGASVPGSSVPGVSVPGVSVPDMSVPDMSVPGASIPGSSVPAC